MVTEQVMQLPAAATRCCSQGQGQAEPPEEQHAVERRAEGQTGLVVNTLAACGTDCESKIAKPGAFGSHRMVRWQNSATMQQGIQTTEDRSHAQRQAGRGSRGGKTNS